MLVGDIMRSDVKTADGGDTFADVAKVMRANGISSVVVLDKGGALTGIVTERDIVNLVAAGGDPHTVEVAHGMTRRHLETIGPKADIAEAADQMVSLQHPPPAGRRQGPRRRHRVDPRPDEVGGRGARGRPRDARHRALPDGAEGGQRAAEAAPAQLSSSSTSASCCSSSIATSGSASCAGVGSSGASPRSSHTVCIPAARAGRMS